MKTFRGVVNCSISYLNAPLQLLRVTATTANLCREASVIWTLAVPKKVMVAAANVTVAEYKTFCSKIAVLVGVAVNVTVVDATLEPSGLLLIFQTLKITKKRRKKEKITKSPIYSTEPVPVTLIDCVSNFALQA
jgi:hypothetical protein